MTRWIPVCVLAALWGCGGEPPAKPEATVADIQARTLKRVETVEAQASKGSATVNDVQQLAQSLRFLAGHARTQKVGTDEQLAALEELAGQLVALTKGPSRQPEDWNPGEDKPVEAPVVSDASTLGEILPKVREAVQGLR
jgi:hypothetical protein